jgi:hypothetical protein
MMMYIPFFTRWARRRQYQRNRLSSNPQVVDSTAEDTPNEVEALGMLTVVVMIGLAGTLWYSVQFGSGAWVRISGIALGVAGAALLVGGLLGFLFGIPRTQQHEGADTPLVLDTPGSNTKPIYRPNTNLEQISDWLTKILIGVGLTQISELRSMFIRASQDVAAAIDPQLRNGSFASAILVFFSVTGFLLGFLWTRLSLVGLMYRADSMLDLNRRLTNVENQRETDALALTYTDRQLNPASDSPAIDISKLKAAIMAASPAVKVHVFGQAAALRRASWRAKKDRHRIPRTIPIFEALVECDRENQFHRNHGQLGYALKDLREPEWSKAFDELSKAIQIREQQEESGYRLYELNRAICMIHMDPAFAVDAASSKTTRAAVLSDLNEGGTDRLERFSHQSGASL